ncbi:MAG: hypothetical protein ABIP30_03645 [Ferruginibacter sp.]
MTYYTTIAFSFSIFIAAIAGIIKSRKVDPSYYPFILCTIAASVNEIVSVILIKQIHNSSITNNIYVFIEAMLIIWQFKKWEVFDNREYLYRFLLISIAALWLWEYRSISKLETIGSFFRITASFVIVICSVTIISRFLIEHNKSLITNPVFMICCGFIFFFTYKIFLEIFWVYTNDADLSFSTYVYEIMSYVNLISNLIYGIAIICIPTKPRFITLY